MTFIEITRDNWLDAIQLEVKPTQYRFMRREVVLYSLAKAYVSRPGEYTPYVIEEDGQLDGQLVGSIRIRNYGHGVGFAAFFIDREHQGRGLGREALLRLIDFVKGQYPHAKEIETAVHPDNTAACKLYESIGLAYTGVVSKEGVVDMEMPI